MITKERLAEIRKTFHPHELDVVTMEALDTIETLLRENERLVGLSGKTNYCLQCEAYARENEKLRRVAEAAEAFMTRPIGRRKDELDDSLKALRGKEKV